MKVYLVFPFLVLLASASPALVGLGRSCIGTSPFVTTNFVVNPYPPTAGAVMTGTMSGTFSTDQYISDLAIKTNFNGGKYVVTYVDLDTKYLYGQVYNFVANVTAGTAQGLYDVQFLLETKQGSGISCWDFTYHI
jgi:hypothetical protein